MDYSCKTAKMEYTRETAEQVLKDFAEYIKHPFTNAEGLTLKQLNFLTDRFPVNLQGWYYSVDLPKYLKFFSDNRNWGWDATGEWTVLEDTSRVCTVGLLPAPPQKVIERAEEELKKRGYVEETEIKSLILALKDDQMFIKDYDCKNFHIELMAEGNIWVNGKGQYNPLIMREGKWAEIVSNKAEEQRAKFKALKEKVEEVIKELKNLEQWDGE